MNCAFSGHRPHGLPWGEDEEDSRCVALKYQLFHEVQSLIFQGVDRFYCGMAQGCDMYFAQCVLDLQKEHPSIQLIAVLPCASQSDRWQERDVARYNRLCEECNEVVLLQTHYAKGCMLRRNHWMVDVSQVLVNVYDGTEGGTGDTIRYAKSKNLTMVSLWL